MITKIKTQPLEPTRFELELIETVNSMVRLLEALQTRLGIINGIINKQEFKIKNLEDYIKKMRNQE